jgi:hypothetical protein
VKRFLNVSSVSSGGERPPGGLCPTRRCMKTMVQTRATKPLLSLTVLAGAGFRRALRAFGAAVRGDRRRDADLDGHPGLWVSRAVRPHSPLKNAPGEGTGPTGRAELVGVPVGRVPSRGALRALQQAAKSAGRDCLAPSVSQVRRLPPAAPPRSARPSLLARNINSAKVANVKPQDP